MTAAEKRIEDAKNKLIHKVASNKDEEKPENMEAAEDMMVAFELLNKYNKDKAFI